jgi:hypothetical protein
VGPFVVERAGALDRTFNGSPDCCGGLRGDAFVAELSVTERLRAGTYSSSISKPLRAARRRWRRCASAAARTSDATAHQPRRACSWTAPIASYRRARCVRGLIRVHNVSDTLHFLSLAPVKPGTTDANVQAFLDGSSSASPLIDGPGAELNVLSPARQARLSWNLPPGTYVMLCFIADDETGMPHAVMGMHKVVVLR